MKLEWKDITSTTCFCETDEFSFVIVKNRGAFVASYDFGQLGRFKTQNRAQEAVEAIYIFLATRDDLIEAQKGL
ncbi:hypothetical protein EHQ53_14115 [Leptospira langatensis]|uniref:Phage protein n=1 Tax=Leptospira langatensis TaxID=2484983 RepID=A0ABY2MD17_9LEPT|nr:hypothetical protein [Leptospira langatensis]TGL39653.1 hypothetical protein EHQ53_14115 [Leptospira langatensis]